MHLLLLLAAPYFQFEATYLHTSLQLVICSSQHHIVHRGSGTGNKAAANSKIAAAILVFLCDAFCAACKKGIAEVGDRRDSVVVNET